MNRSIVIAIAVALAGCASMDQHREACGATALQPPPDHLRQPRIVGSWPNERAITTTRAPAGPITVPPGVKADPDEQWAAWDRAQVEACAQARAAGEQVAVASALGAFAGAALGAAVGAYARPGYYRAGYAYARPWRGPGARRWGR